METPVTSMPSSKCAINCGPVKRKRLISGEDKDFVKKPLTFMDDDKTIRTRQIDGVDDEVGETKGERTSMQPSYKIYNHVTKGMVKESFTDAVKMEIEEWVDTLWLLPDRDSRCKFVAAIMKGLSTETRGYLDLVHRQEKEHAELMNKVMQKFAVFNSRDKGHDYSKDELFTFLVPASFNGADGGKLTKLVATELDRHYMLESHHPQYEEFPYNPECCESDILEMALDRLSRGAAFGSGEIVLSDVEKYMPTFPRGDNDVKQGLFREYIKHHCAMVQGEFDKMFATIVHTKVRCMHDLGNNKRIKVEKFKGALRVDIRQWYESWEGANLMPGKKGVSMPLNRYLMLRDCIEMVEDSLCRVKAGEVTNYSSHLGRNVYVGVNHPYKGVDIRQWFMCEGQKKPGAGIFLNCREWEALCMYDAESFDKYVPELKQTVRCIDKMDHCNQLGMIACPECNPDGLYSDSL